MSVTIVVKAVGAGPLRLVGVPRNDAACRDDRAGRASQAVNEYVAGMSESEAVLVTPAWLARQCCDSIELEVGRYSLVTVTVKLSWRSGGTAAVSYAR